MRSRGPKIDDFRLLGESGRGQRPLLRAEGPQMPSKTVGCQGQGPWTQGQRPWEGTPEGPRLGERGGGPRRGPEGLDPQMGVWGSGGAPRGSRRVKIVPCRTCVILKRLVSPIFHLFPRTFGPREKLKNRRNRSNSATLPFFLFQFLSLFFTFLSSENDPI